MTPSIPKNDAMTVGGQESSAFTTKLPPAPFRIKIPVMAVCVSGSDPYRMGAWRLFPPARLPVICVSFIAVVSAYPDVVPAWTRRAVFVNTNRWPKLYDDLRIGRYYPKGKAKQSGKNQFSHLVLLRLPRAGGWPFRELFNARLKAGT